MKHFKLVYFFLVIFVNITVAQNFSNGISFQLPLYDSLNTTFLPDFPSAVITNSDRITINGDEFVKSGTPINFWGVNVSAAACFPPKAKASQIAARMQKMGINLVRIHHADNPWSGNDGSIFTLTSNSTRSLNPVTLDRMDYFVFQLKQHGIYVNMNLNVSRTYMSNDGVIGYDSIPDFGKGITLFDPHLILLQKEFANQLLSHVNPYTGMAYNVDPSIAMLEMNNENTLYGYWKDDNLQTLDKGGNLLFRHNRMLDSLFNIYLVNKYSSQTALETFWNSGINPQGSELLSNTGFEDASVSPWVVELNSGGSATLTKTSSSPYSGTGAGSFNVTNVSTQSWHVQMKQTGFSIQKDSIYTFTFYAKANSNTSLSLSIMRDNSPYTWYNGTTFNLTNSWQKFTFNIVAPENNTNATRISFNPTQNGTIFFDDLSFKKAGSSGVESGESLASRNIKRVNWSERSNYTTNRVSDLADFYIKTQKVYFDDMKSYLKNNLGLLAPITGTNGLVGTADVLHQVDLDFIDDHSYWDHPNFLGTPWDSNNWYINNSSISKDAYYQAILNSMCGLQLADKPYTISEYNHGYPNRFRTEMVPAIASYSSFQGVDGIMFFQYQGDSNWDETKVDGYFDLQNDVAVLAQFPAAAYAYRNNYIQEDNSPIVFNYQSDYTTKNSKIETGGRWDKITPYDKRVNLTNGTRTGSLSSGTTSSFLSYSNLNSTTFSTNTNEISLNTSLGIQKTGTDKFISVSGFLNNAPNTSAGNLTVTSANDFGTISWLSIDNLPLTSPQKSLLTVSTETQNTGMIWSGTTTVNNNWGSGPTLIRPLTTNLRLNINATSLRLYPLNNVGQESTFTTILPTTANMFDIAIDQSVTQTTWFGIEAIGASLPISLRRFDVKKVDQFANIQWECEPINIKSFVIEKSVNGVDFEFVTEIQSNNLEYFSYNDNNFNYKGIVYYRIKFKYLDETSDYSSIKYILYDLPFVVKALPIPFSHSFYVNINNEEDLANYQIKLFSITGDLVFTKQIDALPLGENNILIDNLSDLPSGNYTLQITSKSNNDFLKIMKL